MIIQIAKKNIGKTKLKIIEIIFQGGGGGVFIPEYDSDPDLLDRHISSDDELHHDILNHHDIIASKPNGVTLNVHL